MAAAAQATVGAERVIGQATGSGLEATAVAEGEAKKPRALLVRATADPAQAIRVSWYVVCNYPAFEVQDRKGVFTLQPPFTKKIPFPKKKPLKCGLSVSASIADGTIDVTLLAR
jgi:hypothetical protein